MHSSRRAVPHAIPLLLAASVATAAPSFHNYGGHVVSNARVVQVNWGSSVTSTTQNALQGFYPAIVNSPYLDWVSEYSTVGLTGFADGQPGSNQRIGRGSYGGMYTITPALTGTTVAYDAIEAELVAQINAGHIPAPTFDWQGIADTVYLVDFPPGTTITYAGTSSCVQFCGVFATLNVGGKNVGAAFIPDLTSGPCATGCGNGTNATDVITQIHSHELLEVITGPETAAATGNTLTRPIGWYDANIGTIANQCNAQGAQVSGYWVEKGWSARANACIAQSPTTLSVCDGSTTLCRQCSAADNGQACSGAHPACETDSTNPAFGECVACATNASCSGTTPVCNKADAGNDTCRACASDSECTGSSAGGHCLSTGACGAFPDAGSGGGGGGSGGGCSTAASGPMPWLVLALIAAAGFARRVRARP